MEIAGEVRKYRMFPRKTKGGDILQNSHWKDQVRGHRTERPLER